MNKQLKVNVWLPRHKREQFISIYKNFEEKYEKAMKTLFFDIEGDVNQYKEELAEEYNTVFNFEIDDPSDILQQIEEDTLEYYRSEKLMEYNLHLSLLSTVYQVFEQQLRGFIYSELNHATNSIRTKENFPDFGFNMGEIKEAYKFINYDLTKTSQWDTVKTLSDLVNTYKHGDGRAARRLYQNRPNFFLKAYYGGERVMDVELTTNGEIVFDIERINFKSYTRSLIEFWEEFPEHLDPIVTVE
jgi:hypothetical protein